MQLMQPVCRAHSHAVAQTLPGFYRHRHRGLRTPRAAAVESRGSQQEQQQQQQQPGGLLPTGAPNTTAAPSSPGQQQAAVLEGVLPQQMPRHVAIIMDGNSRWAQAQGLPAWVGHERGVAALRSAVIFARELGIPALTVFAFSVDNWQRDGAEVEFLLRLFETALQQQLPELQRNGVRLHFMGQLHRLPASLQQQVAACEAATAGNSSLLLNVAVSYGAQQDMTAAVQQLARLVQAGQLQPDQITPELIGQQLSSAAAAAAVGPPDLLIRTSGEQRLSNFMLWECSYTELCFCDCMWPDFSRQHFAAALQQYVRRQRRYGRRA